ncbi:GTP 3',8-cyclase MoaA [Alicyclobacillus tolerans]|uniref:GTP 3',8-cyclase MoaA n=1 Tax=Alicyclobacillus tolerans TaxID=90970 RepID=UPI001EFFBF5D|nr:GTP 3',8-cyclase MoaA [Alicyclobacillus tolerans]MCF8564840.1 GTP 3',8-cyclase MoaA [Alicyclobacillus tolerans]
MPNELTGTPLVPSAGASQNQAPSPETRDALGRRLKDLRISVTDRCNFRCTYCMPKEVFGPDFAFLPHQELLTFEEIARLTQVFVRHGVRKVRLTGGEPLLRRDLEVLIAMLNQIDGVEDIALTTNGSLLTLDKARRLKAAGLRRITISLDSLDNDIFTSMNDVRFPVSKVLEAIDAAKHAGLSPVKINMVVRKGTNDHCVVKMAEHFRGTGHILRFIEYMDVGNSNQWKLDEVVPAAQILEAIDSQWPLEPVSPVLPGEVAKRYRYRDGKGEIGIIASVTQPFCSGCTRARLSSEGLLYTCLFGTRGHDLRAMLREGASDEQISERLESIWTARTDRYSELRSEQTRTQRRNRVEMSHIGG